MRTSNRWFVVATALGLLMLDRAHGEKRLADDNFFSQNFGRPSVFVDLRRAMLDARLTFPM